MWTSRWIWNWKWLCTFSIFLKLINKRINNLIILRQYLDIIIHGKIAIIMLLV